MIGEKPHFITPEEVERGKQLKKELARLIADYKSLAVGNLCARKKKAEAYLAGPIAEQSSAKFRKECMEIEFLLNNPKARAYAGENIRSFEKSDVLPFVRPLVERGFELAQRDLAETIKTENERCRSIIGIPTTFSDVIECARRPVNWFELMLHRLEGVPNAFSRQTLIEILETLPEMLVADSSNGAVSSKK